MSNKAQLIHKKLMICKHITVDNKIVLCRRDGIVELSGPRKATVKETNQLESDTSALLAEIRKAVLRVCITAA